MAGEREAAGKAAWPAAVRAMLASQWCVSCNQHGSAHWACDRLQWKQSSCSMLQAAAEVLPWTVIRLNLKPVHCKQRALVLGVSGCPAQSQLPWAVPTGSDHCYTHSVAPQPTALA